MRFAADDALGLGGVDVRIVEQAHLEFPAEHRRDQLVELRFLEHAFAHEFDQVQVAIGLGQFDVDAGLDGERAGLPLVLGDEMAVRFGAVAQLVDRVVVGDDEAFEAPLLAEHVAQQPAVGMRRDAIDLVVGGHHADGAAFVDGLFEGDRGRSRAARAGRR